MQRSASPRERDYSSALAASRRRRLRKQTSLRVPRYQAAEPDGEGADARRRLEERLDKRPDGGGHVFRLEERGAMAVGPAIGARVGPPDLDRELLGGEAEGPKAQRGARGQSLRDTLERRAGGPAVAGRGLLLDPGRGSGDGDRLALVSHRLAQAGRGGDADDRGERGLVGRGHVAEGGEPGPLERALEMRRKVLEHGERLARE